MSRLLFFIGTNLKITFHPAGSQQELVHVPSLLQGQQATLCFVSLPSVPCAWHRAGLMASCGAGPDANLIRILCLPLSNICRTGTVLRHITPLTSTNHLPVAHKLTLKIKPARHLIYFNFSFSLGDLSSWFCKARSDKNNISIQQVMVKEVKTLQTPFHSHSCQQLALADLTAGTITSFPFFMIIFLSNSW